MESVKLNSPFYFCKILYLEYRLNNIRNRLLKKKKSFVCL
mgnify:CR=1 FL=1